MYILLHGAIGVCTDHQISRLLGHVKHISLFGRTF